MDKQTLLSKLPSFNGEYELITDEQTVGDIINEVLDAHDYFAAHYDKIALCFDGDTVKEVCDNLYSFCKKSFLYYEQTEDEQQTMSPAAMLHLKKVDCKNYAGFCGGVLDGLNRLTERKINWCYRFASYRPFNSTPHHVFIVVNPGKNEIWIDPTPAANVKSPVWQADKKIKAGSNMALHRVSGISNNNVSGLLDTVTPATDGAALGKYSKAFGPFLGLDKYKDGALFVNWSQVADKINQMIPAGPSPGHAYPGNFVKWVFDNDIRGWNFYWPQGVKPGFTADPLLPGSWPRLVITPDHRLTYTFLTPLPDDPANPEIYILTAWAQDLINRFDNNAPHPMKPASMKGFSQGKYGDVNKINMFTEYRGDSIFEDIGHALEDTVNFIKDVGLKIIGSIPRNAFLGLTAINAFNIAGSLWKKMQEGQKDSIAKTWKSVGGNPDKLFNTVEDGHSKPAILGSNVIGDPATGTAALLAAAAPILAIMLKYLDKDGKMTEVLSATKGFLSSKYPDLDLDDYGFLDKATGQRIVPVIDPKDDENLGGGNDDLPSGNFFDDPMAWIKANPLKTAGIGLVLWELLAPKKYRLINK